MNARLRRSRCSASSLLTTVTLNLCLEVTTWSPALLGYLLWQLSQLSPFWKPAAPFMPGLLPGTMIWLGLGLVL